MALDTRSKRASSVCFLLPFVLALPAPDGTIGQGDRQHIALTYSGILAGVQAAPIIAQMSVDAAYEPSLAVDAAYESSIAVDAAYEPSKTVDAVLETE